MTDSSAGYLYAGTANGTYRARGWTEENAAGGEGVTPNGTEPEKVLAGANFERQWDHAIAQDVHTVMLTAWNEWTAQKLPLQTLNGAGVRYYEGGTEHASFIDVFNYEYSRDTEMMRGGYGDNYYMQIVRKLRQFKGIGGEGDGLYANKAVKAFDFTAEESWEQVERKFIDLSGDASVRDHPGYDPSVRLKDVSARADILYVQIADDGQFLYVRVACSEAISAQDRSGEWMRLYFGGSGGWENYRYTVVPESETGASLLRFTGSGKETEPVGSVGFALQGRFASYKIPLSLLGCGAGQAVQVKAVDSKREYALAEDLYCYGDAAPIGRLNYGYKLSA